MDHGHGMMTVHTISLDLKVGRCDDIHPFPLDSAYSINSDLAVGEVEDHKFVKDRQSLGIGGLVEQSHTGVCMSLMTGSEEDPQMEVVQGMIGMDLMVVAEKLKRQKSLVVAVEERIDLLEGRGIQTSLFKYTGYTNLSSASYSSVVGGSPLFCWPLKGISLISRFRHQTFPK